MDVQGKIDRAADDAPQQLHDRVVSRHEPLQISSRVGQFGLRVTDLPSPLRRP